MTESERSEELEIEEEDENDIDTLKTFYKGTKIGSSSFAEAKYKIPKTLLS